MEPVGDSRHQEEAGPLEAGPHIFVILELENGKADHTPNPLKAKTLYLFQSRSAPNEGLQHGCRTPTKKGA
jgi:hypothetical protein